MSKNKGQLGVDRNERILRIRTKFPDPADPNVLQELVSCQQTINELRRKAKREIIEEVLPLLDIVQERIYTRRNAAVRRLPGFWYRAFTRHPLLAGLVCDRERPAMCYLHNVDVGETRKQRGFRLYLHFRQNPYFTNRVLFKEFLTERSHGHAHFALVTPISWRRGQNLLKTLPPHPDAAPSTSFFRWFSQTRTDHVDPTATALCKELWQRPLWYYLQLGEQPDDDTARPVRSSLVELFHQSQTGKADMARFSTARRRILDQLKEL